MIRDGAVDELGVTGMARQLHVSERHLRRVLVTELGAGPQQLNRTRRAQTARMLIEQTRMNLADVAFAAGFASVRQFNEVIRDEFDTTPSRLRGCRRSAPQTTTTSEAPTVVLRLRYRPPFALDHLRTFLAAHAVPGLDRVSTTGEHTRTVPAAHGPAVVTVVLGTVAPEHITARLQLSDLADLSSVVARIRRWLDLDADPALIDDVLRTDPLLDPLVRAQPGLRVAGAVDGFETTVLAVLRSASQHGVPDGAARLVRTFGSPGLDGLFVFPTSATLAALEPTDVEALGIGTRQAGTIRALATAAQRGLILTPGADRAATRETLLRHLGVDAPTVDYLSLRVLGDPDVFPGDAGERARLLSSAVAADPARWRPWRSYALLHLWHTLGLSGPITARSR